VSDGSTIVISPGYMILFVSSFTIEDPQSPPPRISKRVFKLLEEFLHNLLIIYFINIIIK